MSYAAKHKSSRAAKDWAAKRRAAMERAKQLREERRRGLVSDDHTFQPALERIATQNRKIPSPGSDALTYEVRRYGMDQPPTSTPHEYAEQTQQQQEADATFMSSLRGGGDGGSSRGRRQKKRPEWNNDFVEAAPVGAPASAPRAAPASDQHYYSRMRQELKNPHAAPDDGPFDDVDAASRRGGGGGGGATSRPGSGRQRHSHRRRRSSRDHDRGVRDDRPAWNNDFAEPVAAPVPTHASSASATGPTRGGVASKPRVGRLYTPADITGEAPQEQHRSVSQNDTRASCFQPPPARATSQRASSAMDTQGRGAHSAVKPKLALLKKKLKSRHSLRRINSRNRQRSSTAATPPTLPPSDPHAAPEHHFGGVANDGDGDGGGGGGGGGFPGSSGSYAAAYARERESGAGGAGAHPPPRHSRRAQRHAQHPRQQQQQQQQQPYHAGGGAYGNGYPPDVPSHAPEPQYNDLSDDPHTNNREEAAPSFSTAARNRTRSRGRSRAPTTTTASSTASVAAPVVAATACTRQQGCPCSACAIANDVLAGRVPAAATAMAVEPETMAVALFPCRDCGRKFSEQALQRHSRVCRKVFQTKRKKFNATEKRMDNEALAMAREAGRAGGGGGASRRRGRGGASRRARGRRSRAGADRALPTTSGAAGGKKKAWKAKSSAFRDAMRAARGYTAAKAAGREPPPPPVSAPDPSFVPCPTCGRTFNPTAAERHIPRCKSIIAKPKRLIRGSGRAGGGSATIARRAPQRGSARTSSRRARSSAYGRR